MGELHFRKRSTVGRSPTSDLLISDSRVSRLHAHLVRSQRKWTLTVEPSAAPGGLVLVGGRAVEPGEQADLEVGDSVRIGSSPEYRVERASGTLVLTFSDETQRTGSDASLRVVAEDAESVPPSLKSSGDVLPWGTDPDDVDLVLVTTNGVAGLAPDLARLREQRFFLPIAILGPVDPPDWRDLPLAPQGDAYLRASERDPYLQDAVRDICRKHRRAEREARPFLTAEILYAHPAGRVEAHDWVHDAPRSLNLSELQHQVLFVLTQARLEQPDVMGLSVSEVAARLEARSWARSRNTVANELSSRLPARLKEEGLHPALWLAEGTREKIYGLSTLPSAIR